MKVEKGTAVDFHRDETIKAFKDMCESMEEDITQAFGVGAYQFVVNQAINPAMLDEQEHVLFKNNPEYFATIGDTTRSYFTACADGDDGGVNNDEIPLFPPPCKKYKMNIEKVHEAIDSQLAQLFGDENSMYLLRAMTSIDSVDEVSRLLKDKINDNFEEFQKGFAKFSYHWWMFIYEKNVVAPKAGC